MFDDIMEKFVIDSYWDRVSHSLYLDLSTSSLSEIWISDCFDISKKVFPVLTRLFRFKQKGVKAEIRRRELFVSWWF